MTNYFLLTGENDDHEIFEYNEHRQSRILIAYKFNNSPNVWRKCFKHTGIQTASQNFIDWLNTFRTFVTILEQA